jgi:hypothetical protein
MSVHMTVTWRRSPHDAAPGERSPATGGSPAAGRAKAVPQATQKRAEALFAWLHLGQAAASCVPQLEQKRLESEFSL